ncbi:acyl carrier protein [Acetoanaerobium pronyense]|uniref:Acyl carrier protein n=1 Tax=Acetoanaerobium pronyense TaxID=1482736 RepID=A0ABS4KEL9_9FIRM|nr:acyl carrier protein [Acetoanaerobium pronyense]MBP2026215.1 acyl carrier protein [Acetoanaerobium pronyense]
MTIEKVKAILADQLEVSEEEIKPESVLIDDLGADSLDVVEIVMSLEDEFGIEIADEETAKIKTVQDIVTFVDSQK